MNLEEINKINAVREKFLGFFAEMLLDAPKYEQIVYLYKALDSFIKATPADSIYNLKENTAKLGDWLTLNTLSGNVANKLLSEHTGLFFTGKYSIGTTASYYLSPKRVNKADIWDKTVSFYNNNNFIAKKHTFHEDSAGIQLTFINVLVNKSVNMDNKDDLLQNLAIQSEFYENYINPWIDMFYENIINAVHDGSFFQIFANLSLDYIKVDSEAVTEMIDIINS